MDDVISNSLSFKVLGIDPGSKLAGFACIETEDRNRISAYKVIDLGVLRLSPKLSFAQRLANIANSIEQLIDQNKPDAIVVEKAFCYLNPASGLKIGEVRGVILSIAAKRNIKIYEVTPKKVKKTVTGNGNATKEQVAQTVSALMKIDTSKMPYDVTDAVAIAISGVIGS